MSTDRCHARLLSHGTSRGNAQQDDRDRSQFLSLLAHVVDRLGWLCHVYGLMDNQYHLLRETPQPKLSLGMRLLNGCYTQAYYRRHERVGPARERDRTFVADGRGRLRPWERLTGQIYLGSADFMMQPQPNRVIRDILRRETQAQRLPLRLLFRPKGEQPRLVHIAYRQHGYRLAEIADMWVSMLPLSAVA